MVSANLFESSWTIQKKEEGETERERQRERKCKIKKEVELEEVKKRNMQLSAAQLEYRLLS